MDSSSLLISCTVLALLLTFPSSSSSNLVEQEALLSLKASIETDPSAPSLSSWNETSDLCQWRGVTCNNSRGRVTTLDLSGLGLTGSVSPSIGNLSQLQFLFLQKNQLSGELPRQLGALLHLQVLNASSNLIGGAIPPHISNCLNLTALDLSSNKLSGRIPAELGSLSKLKLLDLGKNFLTGTIPDTIGNLSSLSTLDLATNFLNGEIPSDLGRLHKISHLQISINNLTGHLPSSLYNLSSLTFFAFALNDFFGEIPGDIGHRLPNLLTLNFCFNKFTGLYPRSVHNLTNIQTLRFSYNLFHGPVPSGLGNLHDLNMYTIAGNQFVSSAPNGLEFLTAMTNSTKLEYLAINDNLLEGMIPDSVGNLSKSLTKFMLGGNRILGSIPASIGQISSLSLLNMSYNSISGEIPPEIGQLKQLTVLDLAYNKLSGKIPADIGELTMLTKLGLFGNQLEGSIPSSFGKLQNLISLDLSSNDLEGGIPREVFTLSSLSSLLNLSHNSLMGSLPQEISNLQNIIAIDLSYNLLSGNITDYIGKCGSLQTLSMANNSFSGEIPETIGNLKALQSLDLSLNQLSGPIPDSIREIQALDYLNLSFNNLEGVVPTEGVFRNHSAVHLEGNSRLCYSSSCKSTGIHWKVLYSIIVASVALVLLLVVSSICIFLIKRRTNKNFLPTMNSMKGKHPIISYEELHRATESFAATNLLGRGSFGCVYKGVLGDGVKVAVKVLILEAGGALKSFLAECEALRNARHRNLVKLITLCLSLDFKNNEFRALVYEFMSNGSLDDWIRGKRRHADSSGLSLVERLNAIIDMASALDYLHNDCEVQVVHCDLKPSNVMLDEYMTAKVGDFGLAKVLGHKDEAEEHSTATHGLKGSIGYIPPEYGFGGKPSAKGDVYSYGVMLLELLTGKSPTNEQFAGNLSLKTWVATAFPCELMQVLDAELTIAGAVNYGRQQISREKQDECLTSMVRVALACTEESPDARLTIRDALAQLKSTRDDLMRPAVATNNYNYINVNIQ
ncbi:hypothetical protein Cni_G18827 [Canna indica]|uniref:Receptor kinase-like protein Xa21 n=1 Tax=Canna indica TaxID=4628 RepID=A0AAQ3KN83_9LILI|nr:hypothetical protein Cni_G18827 [Canna indica]